ncbi:hypothetical protein NHL50_02930 [Acidimicrobiia bacterium EGI L10123]|uniref:hypothetical protein n=1 Tax=Salinilacustrithrix flava TaxID=2957203 RepID=UPI003D7C29CB|nr:hypothetical protein [Acidimicrobiia bacterium EGI L10123]
MRRVAVTAALVLTVGIGHLLVVGVVLVRGHVLDEGLYLGALARADAYERAYTDVLTDPEIDAVAADLLGGLRFEAVDPDEARVIATNTLRWVVPPSRLRTGTEALLAEVLAYVRGDVARADAPVDLRAELARIEAAGVQHARALLATGTESVSATIQRYREAVGAFLTALAAGQVPSVVPVPAPAIDRDAVASVLDAVADRTGADPAAVAALAAAGSDHDAVVVAASEAIRVRADAARQALGDRLADGRAFDPVAQLAERAGEPRRSVLANLDTVRDLASWFGPAALAIGASVTLAAVVAIVLRDRRRPRRAMLILAGGGVAAAAMTVAGWLAVRSVVRPPLAAATGTGPGTWDLPPGLRGVVSDVQAELASALGGAALRLAALPLAVGGVLAVGAALAGATARASGPRARPRRTVALAAATAVVLGGVGWVLAPSPQSEETCNGHVELCDRRYDEVVQAATHNSMSSPDVVEVWPEHDETIGEQLDSGIRALLIDTHYWTDVVSVEQLAAIDPAIPRAVVDATFAIEGRTRASGRPGTYLCHNHCLWGALPLVDALVDVRAFLDANPREVVTLIVQDAITTEDTIDAFEAAGLTPYLHAHDDGEPWATLGELVDRGERLVVFAEEEGPPPNWYHAAFAHIQDTPYRFASVDDLSCDRNRGPADAPLFLLNHWLEAVAPDRRNAVAANAEDVIVDRAHRCGVERGRLPNFVAVDFAGIGDVRSAVDRLNGLAAARRG